MIVRIRERLPVPQLERSERNEKVNTIIIGEITEFYFLERRMADLTEHSDQSDHGETTQCAGYDNEKPDP